MSVARLRLAPAGETRFRPRAPFFMIRLDPRGAQVAARPEDYDWGNLPVPPAPLPQLTGPGAGP
jgi:hypothetical protein